MSEKNQRNIFVNLCHGNEPYILGTGIAQGIREKFRSDGNDVQIIVPLLYEGRQERIMKEEGLLDEGVHLDSTLGDMYKPIIFADASFDTNVVNILTQGDATKDAVRTHLREHYGDVFAEINGGAHFTSETEAGVFLAYPSIYSELYQRTLDEPDLIKHFNRDNLERLTEKMVQLDDEIEVFYIPSYHMLSFDRERKPFDREISTPPLKRIPVKNTDDIPEESIYVMLSGTGSEFESSLQRARDMRAAGYHVIVPPWSPEDLGDEYERRGPEIFSNDNLVQVISRPGWGTIWGAQNAGTAFDYMPYTPGDEPEIYFNIKTLDAIPVETATARQKDFFGTLDGVEYVVNDVYGRIAS